MRFARIFLLSVFFCAYVRPAEERSTAPVTTLSSEAADMVRKWWKEGTAAGNIGDFYDNRDRGHMPLNLNAFPQLTKVTYSSNEIARGMDYATPRTVRTNVTIANSSTSRGAPEGGSNTRSLYVRPGGPALAYELYVFNNLHAFPEHMDHDPGRNGTPGWGDLFPVNTPYVYTSQGSSGSELKFMEAAALTLAAFRPEVKTKLAQKGLLLPTLQMLLRSSYKPGGESVDYLSGRAHPSVFESAMIDAAAMVRGAHEITLETLPPIAKMRVLDEDQPRQGVDFFDLARNERLCDTPCAIGRIFRGANQTRRIVVSADDSFDQNFRKLTWHWVVLRGDTNRIQIKPLNSRNSTVEIKVSYHERRPIYPGAPIDSNRIDIGCFVHNGVNYSAPSFVCYFFPDNEARGYDADRRLLDIGYAAGETRVTIDNWKKFFELIGEESPRAEFLRSRMSAEEWKTMLTAGAGYSPVAEAEHAAREAQRPVREAYYALIAKMNEMEQKSPQKTNEIAEGRRALNNLGAEDRAAENRVNDAVSAVKTYLAPTSRIVETAISNWVTNPNFTFTDRRDLERLFKAADRSVRDAIEQGKELLTSNGLMKESKGLDFSFTPLRAKAGPLEERLTPYERCLVERLNAAVVGLLVLRGCATSSFTENYVDGLINARKTWRDVYHYDATGKISGWTRYTPGGAPAEFNALGEVPEKGKTKRARYESKPDPSNKFRARLDWSVAE
jgi:hypothetical protein